jgi:hypothetical protein
MVLQRFHRIDFMWVTELQLVGRSHEAILSFLKLIYKLPEELKIS